MTGAVMYGSIRTIYEQALRTTNWTQILSPLQFLPIGKTRLAKAAKCSGLTWNVMSEQTMDLSNILHDLASTSTVMLNSLRLVIYESVRCTLMERAIIDRTLCRGTSKMFAQTFYPCSQTREIRSYADNMRSGHTLDMLKIVSACSITASLRKVTYGSRYSVDASTNPSAGDLNTRCQNIDTGTIIGPFDQRIIVCCSGHGTYSRFR